MTECFWLRPVIVWRRLDVFGCLLLGGYCYAAARWFISEGLSSVGATICHQSTVSLVVAMHHRVVKRLN